MGLLYEEELEKFGIFPRKMKNIKGESEGNPSCAP
jgi:hypothetical protein